MTINLFKSLLHNIGIVMLCLAALIMTAVHLPFMNLMIRREERQLEEKFGDSFRVYKRQVRRWV